MGAPRPGRVLVAEGELTARVAELGRAIARDYARKHPVLVGVLQGAVPFVADLMRVLPIDLTVDFIRPSSYGAGTSSSGTVRLVADLAIDIADRHVLIVDDIRSEEHTSEPSHGYISYAVFCLKKKKKQQY